MHCARLVGYAAVGATLAGSIGCSGTDDAAAPQKPGPVGEAYAALTAGEIERAPQLTAALDAQVQATPDDGMATFYAGLMRLWHFAEGTPAAGANLADEGAAIVERISHSRSFLPTDARVPGFLGLSRTLLGTFTADPAMLATADSDLSDSIAMLPAYGYFLRATSKGFSAANTPEFAMAVSDLGLLTEACGYTQGADGSFRYLEGRQDYQHHVCNNEGIVPHVFEGVFITYGDFALKHGDDVERVRAIYKSAQNSPTYASWPYAAALEQRIADIDANAALYADGDPSNDPAQWTLTKQVCVGCHQK
jgi:hypothetical protein